MSRSAWDLDTGRDVDWRIRGACAVPAADPDLWSSTSPVGQGRAVWLCRNACPVRAQCLAWAESNRQLIGETVTGGVLWAKVRNRAVVRRAPVQPKPIPPDWVQLPAGPSGLLFRIDEIRAMVAAGMSNRDIRSRLGTSDDAVRSFLHRHGIRRYR